jgi:predicted enzyme related to lactoylglutathione lyase
MSERNGYPQGTPCWADVWTDDLEGGRAFYGALFGWDWEVNSDLGFGGYSIATLRGKRVVGLSSKMGSDQPTAWVTYFAVDDADAFAAAVPGAGGTVVAPPMDIADQGRMALATDPAGAFFGVWQQAVHRGSELVDEPGTPVWNELVAPDIDKAGEFYRATLGIGFEDMAGSDPSMPVYKLLKADGRTVGGAMPPMPEMGDLPPHWGIYFEVTDADDAVSRAQDLGAQVLSPVQSTLADPQGGAFAIIASGSTE